MFDVCVCVCVYALAQDCFELAAGVAQLCHGTHADKVEAAFALLDANSGACASSLPFLDTTPCCPALPFLASTGLLCD